LRVAVLGDIHANLEALEAVLKALDEQEVEDCYCVGDIVGYGADPGACVDRVRELGIVTVAGNHDHAAVEKTSIELFNPEARAAALWTREALDDEQKTYLSDLVLTYETDNFAVVHSTLHGPEMFNYVLNTFDALLCFQHLTKPVCFIGHSHVPVSFVESDRIYADFGSTVQLQDGQRALINVGSVGQPRDQDPRASFFVYDTEAKSGELIRVEYEVETACGKIIDAGLPHMNAVRIQLGQ